MIYLMRVCTLSIAFWMHLKSNELSDGIFIWNKYKHWIHKFVLKQCWCCRFCQCIITAWQTNQVMFVTTLNFASISSSLSSSLPPLCLLVSLSLKIVTQINFVSFIIEWEINCDLINSILWLLPTDCNGIYVLIRDNSQHLLST